eukprot:TRINITY_DN4925_c0_g1_i1.p1 TRINITY_DN4925_c0_g1~~TRINITY_DN4925_c0_g1_i1.p1  ORF type:complete len:424 (+),score=76.09 TRINITY_DN4925_c0_g1_i1:81-1352(+)
MKESVAIFDWEVFHDEIGSGNAFKYLNKFFKWSDDSSIPSNINLFRALEYDVKFWGNKKNMDKIRRMISKEDQNLKRILDHASYSTFQLVISDGLDPKQLEPIAAAKERLFENLDLTTLRSDLELNGISQRNLLFSKMEKKRLIEIMLEIEDATLIDYVINRRQWEQRDSKEWKNSVVNINLSTDVSNVMVSFMKYIKLDMIFSNAACNLYSYQMSRLAQNKVDGIIKILEEFEKKIEEGVVIQEHVEQFIMIEDGILWDKVKDTKEYKRDEWIKNVRLVRNNKGLFKSIVYLLDHIRFETVIDSSEEYLSQLKQDLQKSDGQSNLDEMNDRLKEFCDKIVESLNDKHNKEVTYIENQMKTHTSEEEQILPSQMANWTKRLKISPQRLKQILEDLLEKKKVNRTLKNGKPHKYYYLQNTRRFK